jgi:hypothetical protein
VIHDVVAHEITRVMEVMEVWQMLIVVVVLIELTVCPVELGVEIAEPLAASGMVVILLV